MLSGKREYQYMDTPEAVWDVAANLPETEKSIADTTTRFHGQFADCMEMYASASTVAEYLNAHKGWFRRCALQTFLRIHSSPEEVSRVLANATPDQLTLCSIKSS